LNYFSFSFFKFFRPETGGWYVSLVEINRGHQSLYGWCFLALVWMPKYRRLKLFYNQTA
jgi:hypothetical protein